MPQQKGLQLKTKKVPYSFCLGVSLTCECQTILK